MNLSFKKILQTFVPFLILGIVIAGIVGLLIMFSYVFLWGIFIGAVLWLVNFIKNALFMPRKKINIKVGLLSMMMKNKLFLSKYMQYHMPPS